jgi:hypothetical protein
MMEGYPDAMALWDEAWTGCWAIMCTAHRAICTLWRRNCGLGGWVRFLILGDGFWWLKLRLGGLKRRWKEKLKLDDFSGVWLAESVIKWLTVSEVALKFEKKLLDIFLQSCFEAFKLTCASCQEIYWCYSFDNFGMQIEAMICAHVPCHRMAGQ